MKNKNKNNFKKWDVSIATAFLMINLGLTISALLEPSNAYAVIVDDAATGATAPLPIGNNVVDDTTPPPSSAVGSAQSPLSQLQQIGTGTKLPDFYFSGGQHPDSAVDYEYKGVSTLTSTALFLIDLFKYLMSGIALVMMVIYSIKYVVGGSNEEDTKKNTKAIGISVAGLIIIQLADVAVRKVFFGDNGEILEDVTTAQQFAEAGTEQLRGIIGMVQVALGAISALVMIINGLRIMFSGGEEEARKKGLKNIAYAAGGLIIIGISELVVKTFVFKDQGAAIPDVAAGRSIIITITNFVSGFVATIAFVVLLYAGYLYVAAGSVDSTRETVKKLITGAVIGIILALGAYAITNTVLTFKEDNEFTPVHETINP